MAAYRFSAAERYAVFTVHNERCWLCGEPVALLDVEVDHIIPESLIGKPGLAAILAELGLPADYDLNSFANWMPAHRRCNREKGDAVFRASPMILLRLQAAAERVARAEELHDGYLTDRRISRAINIIVSAHEMGGFAPRHSKMIERLVAIVEDRHDRNREVSDRGTPLFIAPWLEVVHEDANWLMLRGPGGLVGGRPKAERLDPSWDCPNCGPTGWNGTRCITCGMMNDGD